MFLYKPSYKPLTQCMFLYKLLEVKRGVELSNHSIPTCTVCTKTYTKCTVCRTVCTKTQQFVRSSRTLHVKPKKMRYGNRVSGIGVRYLASASGIRYRYQVFSLSVSVAGRKYLPPARRRGDPRTVRVSLSRGRWCRGASSCFT